MLTICHISDSHGFLHKLPKQIDVIIHSGDLMPNARRENYHDANKSFPTLESEYQKQWIINNIENIRSWLDGRPFIFLPGNHDYFDGVCDILNDNKIQAIDICNKQTTFGDLKIYGFPFVPWIGPSWNYSIQNDQMKKEVDRLLPMFEQGIDILVCHAPLYGILDGVPIRQYNIGQNNNELADVQLEHIGNIPLTNLLTNKVEKLPQWILVGHCHKGNGWDECLGIKISNAATTVHVLHV